LLDKRVSLIPVYDSVRGHLVCFQLELLNILERVVVVQQRSDFWAPWCIYLYGCLVARNLSGCVVTLILFCDEVEHCIGVFTNWHEAKGEIFHQVLYSELTTFLGLADWATRFAEDGVNWNNALPEGARTRAYYTPVSVINGGSFPIGTHHLLVNRDF
jgi:hypothetical protein